MNKTFSTLTFEDVSQYLSFVTEEDRSEVELYLRAAQSYVRTYTALSDEDLDANEYFIMPVLMLTSSFYENKSIEMTGKLSAVYSGLLRLGMVHDL